MIDAIRELVAIYQIPLAWTGAVFVAAVAIGLVLWAVSGLWRLMVRGYRWLVSRKPIRQALCRHAWGPQPIMEWRVYCDGAETQKCRKCGKYRWVAKYVLARND